MRYALVLILLISIPAQAEEIRVAAASDLTFAIKEIITGFEKETGNRVRLTLGSSGNLSALIEQGAPFDVFLPAGMDYARQLEKAGRVAPGGQFIYGHGRIVLWLPRTSSIDVETLGMDALVQATVKKIAIANPAHAPYGQAAVSAMQKTGLYARVQSKLVLGESVSQAAQFVQSGAADLGIIALSLAQSEPMRQTGHYWVVPTSMHPPLEQAAVLVKGASPAARSFFEWLRKPQAVEVLKRYGFQ